MSDNILTIVASNRNRIDLQKNSTIFFLKSLEKQTYKDFNLLIVDGGSDNFQEIDLVFKQKKFNLNAKIIQFIIDEKFERAKLNNVGIRNSKTPYVLTTDVDMFFASDFVSTIVKNLFVNTFIESRTLYWKKKTTDLIYNNKLNPFFDIESCKIGRIKRRSTAGGCQCAHKDLWYAVRGFDERYVGWGSEDSDLLQRMTMFGAKILWLGETRESIKVFHQPHEKNVTKELQEQCKNKKLLESIKSYKVNMKGWGGIYE